MSEEQNWERERLIVSERKKMKRRILLPFMFFLDPNYLVGNYESNVLPMRVS
jgi:hypothetical protein